MRQARRILMRVPVTKSMKLFGEARLAQSKAFRSFGLAKKRGEIPFSLF